MTHVLLLAVNDLRSIVRDKLLVFAFSMPFILILLGVWGIPWISEEIFDLSPYSGLLLSFIIIETAIIFGFVFGFMLIDERDDNIISALQVLPVSPLVFLTYRLLFAWLFTFLYSVLAVVIVDWVRVPILSFLPLGILFALLAPIIALAMVVSSGNKVEALAVYKGLNLIALAPLASVFFPSVWGYLFGIIPHFWTITALNGLILTGHLDYRVLLIGAIFHGAVLAWLYGRFTVSSFT